MRIGCATLTSILLAAVTLAAPSANAEPANSSNLLWRIETSEAAPSYVFGTMHSDRDEVLDLPTKVEDAFASAERYAFELDFDGGIQTKMARQMMNTSGKPLRDQLDETRWQQLTQVAEQQGLPASSLNRFEPWAVAMTLAMPQIEPQSALDWVLYRRAQDQEAAVTGLESVAEQVSVFKDIPESKQLALLNRVVDMRQSGRLRELHDQSAEAWLNEDLARLMAISDNNPMMPDPQSQADFQERLITERNTRMTKRMQPLINKGGAFIAIGALHLPGDRGVIEQLKDAGYEVTALR